MEVEVDFIDAVFVTVAVSVYVTDVCIENAGRTYFDGSREVDFMTGNADPAGAVRLHEYCRNWVETDPCIAVGDERFRGYRESRRPGLHQNLWTKYADSWHNRIQNHNTLDAVTAVAEEGAHGDSECVRAGWLQQMAINSCGWAELVVLV